MLSDRVEENVSWAMVQADGAGGVAQNSNAASDELVGESHVERCDVLHRRLKRIVKARGSLDLQEAEALREAQRMGLWRRFGYASLVNYMEMELGYSPRTAMERLRVANALPQLPQIAAAIEQGDLTFSGAKELTRVATPETETVWLGATKDMNTREVEQVVSGHRPGDVPTDPVDPKLQLRTLRFDVTGEVYALERQAKLASRKIRGAWPSDSELLEAAFRAFIAGDVADEEVVAKRVANANRELVRKRVVSSASEELVGMIAAGEDVGGKCLADAGMGKRVVDAAHEDLLAGGKAQASALETHAVGGAGSVSVAIDESVPGKSRPTRRVVAPYQVAVTVCTDCKRGWQDGAGEVIAMSPAAVERALCDCQVIGDLDDNEVHRSWQAIPPATRQKVMRQAHGKCQVPGCRSTSNIDAHHLRFRKHGGTNALDNLMALCELCRARHNGHYADYRIMPRRGGALDEDAGVLRGIIRGRSRTREACRRAGIGADLHAAARSWQAPAPSW